MPFDIINRAVGGVIIVLSLLTNRMTRTAV